MDDLTIPLGQNRKEEPDRDWAGPLLRLAVILLCLPPASFIGWLLFAEDRSGGEPIAASQVMLATETAGTQTQATAPKIASGSSRAIAQQPRPSAGSQTVTIIDGSSGKHQDVVVPNSSPMAAN
jgi:hypothetical protein